MNIGQAHIASLIEIRQLGVIQTKQPQDRSVRIMRIQWILHRPQSELIGSPNHLPALDPAAGHPHRESVRMMVATVLALRQRRASELAPPNYQRRFQQTESFQIRQQPRNRLIGLLTHL